MVDVPAHRRSCPLCGSDRLEDSRLGGTPLLHCACCDLTILADPRTGESLQDYYATSYEITPPDTAATEARRIARWPEQVRLLELLAGFRAPPFRLLDIGCDRGHFLDEARRFGIEGTGVEPSEAARAYCDRIGLNVVRSLGDVESRFECITYWHSLEHLLDPVASLLRAGELLVDEGIVAIRVPDFGCGWRKALGARWTWFQPYNHVFHFSRHSLAQLLDRTGFDVTLVRSQRPGDSLTRDADRLAHRTFCRVQGTSRPLRKKIGAFVEALTGVELLVVGRKRAV